MRACASQFLANERARVRAHVCTWHPCARVDARVQHVTGSTPSLQLGAATRRADQLVVTSLLGTLRIVQALLQPAAVNGSTG